MLRQTQHHYDYVETSDAHVAWLAAGRRLVPSPALTALIVSHLDRLRNTRKHLITVLLIQRVILTADVFEIAT